AAAIAGGGSENDIGPGITYFKQLATQGRLLETNDPMEALKSGRAAVVILWDFNALTVRDQLMAADSRRQFEACIPADGTIQSGYATIINAKGDHPETAAFAREYILSDAGQISLAKGYATPVRSVPIPAEVQVKRIPQEQYAGARMISDLDVWFLNSENLTVQWESEIAHQ
ncbi:MAG: extracellular solute-binding protein, partial [Eubacterium sp.]